MKFLLSLITLAVLLSVNLYAQPNRIYSISLMGGITIPTENLADQFNTGYNIGIELETRKNSFALFTSARVSIVTSPILAIEFELSEDKTYWIYTLGEISAGGRWYLGNSKPLSANIDLALSIYTGNFFRKIPWGFQPGIGGNVNLSKNLSANLNLKVNILEDNDWETYIGIYSGVRYSF